jgi:hypothetical protein
MSTSVLSSLPAVEDIAYEFDVFINYHRTDADDVAAIANRLRATGLRVWFDQWSIPKGATWINEMSKGIRRSRALAAFIGPAVTGYWQENEYQQALIIQRQRNNLIIPVLLPGASAERIPDFLSLFNAVDFSRGLSNENELTAFVSSIRDYQPGVVGNTPAPAPQTLPMLQPDLAEPVEDLLSALASDNITFFLGSETNAANSVPASRECDIAFRLLASLESATTPTVCPSCHAHYPRSLRCPSCGIPNPEPNLPSMLLPADIAALYYAVNKRDDGLEDLVSEIVKSRARADGGMHDSLARLLPRLMNFRRPTGKKTYRQLIVNASLDTLMERALVENRIRFVRIIARRDDPNNRKSRLFDVNDYSAVEFSADGSAVLPKTNQKYPLGSHEEIDRFIQECGKRTISGDQAPELLGGDQVLFPVLFKVRGSHDVRRSSAISAVHFTEIARSLALEDRLIEPLRDTASHTPIVFMGMNFLGPEFRLSVQTVLLNDMTSDSPRYLFQPVPDAVTDNCFGRLEAGIWTKLKDRARDRNVRIVERSPEDALSALAQAVKAQG